MIFYGIDITTEIWKHVKEAHFETPEEALEVIREVAYDSWEPDAAYADDWARIKSQTPDYETTPYSPDKYIVENAVRYFLGEALQACCPWINDLMACLQGDDSIHPIIAILRNGFYKSNTPGGYSESNRLMVGLWPTAFPLTVGKAALPAEFVKQAKWIEFFTEE